MRIRTRFIVRALPVLRPGCLSQSPRQVQGMLSVLRAAGVHPIHRAGTLFQVVLVYINVGEAELVGATLLEKKHAKSKRASQPPLFLMRPPLQRQKSKARDRNQKAEAFIHTRAHSTNTIAQQTGNMREQGKDKRARFVRLSEPCFLPLPSNSPACLHDDALSESPSSFSRRILPP